MKMLEDILAFATLIGLGYVILVWGTIAQAIAG